MMRLHLLGVNGPFPESRGATSGYLLEAGDSLFQFDLGSDKFMLQIIKFAVLRIYLILQGIHLFFDLKVIIGYVKQ